MVCKIFVVSVFCVKSFGVKVMFCLFIVVLIVRVVWFMFRVVLGGGRLRFV